MVQLQISSNDVSLLFFHSSIKYIQHVKSTPPVRLALNEFLLTTIQMYCPKPTYDIVNIGLHFTLKNVRPYAAPCSEA